MNWIIMNLLSNLHFAVLSAFVKTVHDTNLFFCYEIHDRHQDLMRQMTWNYFRFEWSDSGHGVGRFFFLQQISQDVGHHTGHPRRFRQELRIPKRRQSKAVLGGGANVRAWRARAYFIRSLLKSPRMFTTRSSLNVLQRAPPPHGDKR